MSAKHFCAWATLATLLAGSGCCHLCDRWCGDNHYSAGAAQPCCTPCNPAPACCPAVTGPVSAPPAGSWQRSYPNACCP